MLGMCDLAAMVSVGMLWEVRYVVMTAAAAVVSPGGLGEGARMKDWRKAMCKEESLERAVRRSALVGGIVCEVMFCAVLWTV